MRAARLYEYLTLVSTVRVTGYGLRVTGTRSCIKIVICVRGPPVCDRPMYLFNASLLLENKKKQ